MKNNYDNAAWFYDRLTRLVYGKTLVRAQQYAISAVPAGASILIVGGGTGWILDELTTLHSEGLVITYVDVSANMIALARKRNVGGNKAIFINDVVQHAPLDDRYDVVLTPFLFDNLSERSATEVFDSMHARLKKDGLWLYVDFNVVATSALWQKTLLAMMYLFFKTLCGVEANKLPDMEQHFQVDRYKLEGERVFLKKFIVSRVYRKTISN